MVFEKENTIPLVKPQEDKKYSFQSQYCMFLTLKSLIDCFRKRKAKQAKHPKLVNHSLRMEPGNFQHEPNALSEGFVLGHLSLTCS